ncbi:hypothetical protein R5P67_00845 [Oenococcus oeni]|uniref:hypothetical protein n=1 Tax=Oenococcus oeni TaxID=1247 RepID=UPI000AE45FC0|nr:hypothetical protein [Oenococcus oeni]
MTEAAYTKTCIDRAEGQTHLLLDDVQADDQIFFQTVLLSLDERFKGRSDSLEKNITGVFNSLVELRIINQAIMSGKAIVFPSDFPYESFLSFKNGDQIVLTREKLLAFVELFFKQIRQIFQSE